MKLEVLGSVMKQENMDIIEKMNIKTDAILINQCNKNDYKEMKLSNNRIVKMYFFNERGVGLSRNNALMRAKEEIIVFADEDEIFVDDYEKLIIQAFEKQKDADIILFNVPSKNPKRSSKLIKKNERVRWYNCLKYGAVHIAARREKIISNNIMFTLLFGGGAEYSSGEDSVFIKECLNNKLKIYTNRAIIGYVAQEESTWFQGYNEKYFVDKGALYAHIYNKFSLILCIQFLLRHKEIYRKMGLIVSIRLMNKGIKEMRKKMHG